MFEFLRKKEKFPEDGKVEEEEFFKESRYFGDHVFVKISLRQRRCGLTEKGEAYFKSFENPTEVIQHLGTFCIGAIEGRSIISVQNNMFLCDYGEFLAFQFMTRAFSITYFQLIPKGEFEGNGVEVPDAVIKDDNVFPAKVFKDARG